MNKILLEDRRSTLLSRSKSGAEYRGDKSKGKNRYQRRLHSKLASSIKHFNTINMDKFFKTGIIDVTVDVTGETNIYQVRMSFAGILDELYKIVNKDKPLDRKDILRALTRAFNSDDVYVNCSCPDWCLHPDTPIKLLDGRVVPVSTLKELHEAGEELWVYSTNTLGDFKPGLVEDVWISSITDTFVKVVLDSGEELITTPNHGYMLRDGSYIEAGKLTPGVSLMPLYLSSTSNGYETVKLNSEPHTSFHSVYKLVAQECLGEAIEDARLRSGEDIIAIHHTNFNKKDNSPGNLKPMGKLEHWHYHCQHTVESGNLEKFIAGGQKHNNLVADHTTPEYERQAQVMRETMQAYRSNRTDEEFQRYRESCSNNTKAAWERGCFDTEAYRAAAHKRGEALHTPEVEQLTHKGVLQYWSNLSDDEREARAATARLNQKKAVEAVRGSKRSEEAKEKTRKTRSLRTAEEKALHQIRIRDSKLLNTLNILLSNNIPITFDNIKEYNRPGYPNPAKHFATEHELIEYYSLDDRYNHKIVSVEFITLEDTPVYDIQVKEWNNFMVQGVILHNCYRFKHWATVGDFLVGDPENRPIRSNVWHAGATKDDPNGLEAGNYYNDRGSGCKHVNLVLSDSSWLIKVAAVIYNYIMYMKDNNERLYQKYIYPAIYQEPYENRQLSIFDDEEEILDSEKDDIKASNQAARERGRFKTGNEYRFQKKNKDQVTFDDLEDEEIPQEEDNLEDKNL